MIQFHVELELSGEGGGWTNIDSDVLAAVPIRLKYGIEGSTVHDRVAGAGSLTFALNNSEYNSRGLLGLYTVGHANCLSGFALGIGVRLSIEADGVALYYKWQGKIIRVQPTASIYGVRQVMISCVDWMDEAARTKIRNIPVQISQRSDQVFRTILANVTKQPPATEVGYGMEQYAYALDNSQDEGFSVLTEFQKLANSELGFIYVKGSPTQGGILTFEDRRKRGTVVTSKSTLADSNMVNASRARDEVINRVQVKVHPRRVDVAGGAFSPDSISGLMSWISADTITGLNDGDPVASWLDRTANLNNFTAAGTARPTYKTGIVNGKPVVRFDGTTDDMTGPLQSAVATVDLMQVFMVYNRRSSTGSQQELLSTSVTLMFENIAGSLYTARNRDGTGNEDSPIATTPGSWRIATYSHQAGNIRAGSNDTRDASLVSTPSGSVAAGFATALHLGASNGSTLFGAIDVAEVLIYNVSLTEAQRENIESYLANKYGITLPYPMTGLGTPSTVIFTLDQVPYIARNTSQTFKCPYKDPSQKKARIGAISQVTPVATTDYMFNATADNSGQDLTSQLAFTITFGGNSATVTITNNGPNDGYLTLFQLRGLGVFDDGEVILEASDTSSIATFGENLIPFDMVYQSDPNVANDASYYLLAQSKSSVNVLTQVAFIANQSQDMITQAIQREISDRIDFSEPLTAVSGSFFINAIALELDSEGVLRCTWTVIPAVTQNYLILDDPVYGILDTDRLAYGLWNRYWILGVAALDTDTRVNP